MHIDQLEATFIRLSAVMMLVFAGAIAIAVFGLGIQLPGVVEEIDPAEVQTAPGFSDADGLRQVYEGKYEAHIIASASRGWVFIPDQIEVPAGSEVTFFLASEDVIHGFKVQDTNINVMVIPGQISEFTHTFNEPGEYQFYCHEYCGGAHHNMAGVVNVVEQ